VTCGRSLGRTCRKESVEHARALVIRTVRPGCSRTPPRDGFHRDVLMLNGRAASAKCAGRTALLQGYSSFWFCRGMGHAPSPRGSSSLAAGALSLMFGLMFLLQLYAARRLFARPPKSSPSRARRRPRRCPSIGRRPARRFQPTPVDAPGARSTRSSTKPPQPHTSSLCQRDWPESSLRLERGCLRSIRTHTAKGMAVRSINTHGTLNSLPSVEMNGFIAP